MSLDFGFPGPTGTRGSAIVGIVVCVILVLVTIALLAGGSQ